MYGDLGIRKLKSGKWQGYMYYYAADGKRRQITRTAKAKKKADAKAELKLWEAEERRKAESHEQLHSGEKTVEEVVTEFLDEQLNRGFLEKSTYYSQMTNCKRNIFPYLGDYGFAGVNNIIIEQWLSDLAAKGLKQSTIHTVYAILNKTYSHYLFAGSISENPCSHVRTPKKGANRVTFLDADQLHDMMCYLNEDYPEGHYLWMAVNLAVLAGLRRGEICGLRFHDIDFERGTISIESAVGIAEGGTYTKEPKNSSSKREFPMPEQLPPLIRTRMLYLEKEYGTVDNSWFVIGEAKKHRPPTTLSNEFKRFVRKYGIVDHYGKEVTLHSLRHNLATVGVKNNVDIASLSNMLGHASKSMTLDTYSSVAPTAMRVAAKTMSKAFSEETEALALDDPVDEE